MKTGIEKKRLKTNVMSYQKQCFIGRYNSEMQKYQGNRLIKERNGYKLVNQYIEVLALQKQLQLKLYYILENISNFE